MLLLDAVDMIYGTPISVHALASPTSLSVWKIVCTPTGAISTGESGTQGISHRTLHPSRTPGIAKG